MAQSTTPVHTEDFRRQAVELILTEKLTVAEVARRLGINPETLRKWKRKYHPAPTPTTPPSAEQELRRLREENRQLKMEREILTKAATFFAREASRSSPSSATTATPGRSPRCAGASVSPRPVTTPGRSGPPTPASDDTPP
jgi:transposase